MRARGSFAALLDRGSRVGGARIGWRTTREGKVFFLVTVGVGVAAVNTGNNLLFLVLGFLLALTILSGVMSELVLSRVRVERHLPERAFVGQVALIELALRNGKARLESYSLEVEDVVTGAPTERRCYFLKVAPGGEQVAAYRRTPTQRGMMRLDGYRVATRYPFGIIEKSRSWDAPGELLVYPALLAAPDAALARVIGAEDIPGARTGAGSEVAGLREYREGDDARAVHWRRSAALGRVVARERLRDEALRVALVVDNARPVDAGEAWDAAFEQAIARAAWFAQRALARGAAVEVLARGARSPLVAAGGAADPVWRFLALLEAVPAHTAPALATAGGAARTITVRAPGAEGA